MEKVTYPIKKVVVHRGNLRWAPESTRPALTQAVRLPHSTGFEIDIQATAPDNKGERQLVVVQGDLKRTSDIVKQYPQFNKEGPILPTQVPWDIIKTLDAGSWAEQELGDRFKEEYQKQPVLLIEEVLDEYPTADKVFEVKTKGIGEQTLRKVRDSRSPLETVTFISFERENTHTIKELAPEATVVQLVRPGIRKELDLAKLKQKGIGLGMRIDEDENLPQECARRGLEIFPYSPMAEIDDDAVKRLFNGDPMLPQGIILNDPNQMLPRIFPKE